MKPPSVLTSSRFQGRQQRLDHHDLRYGSEQLRSALRTQRPLRHLDRNQQCRTALASVTTPDGQKTIQGGVVEFQQLLGDLNGYTSFEDAFPILDERQLAIRNVWERSTSASSSSSIFEREGRFYVFESLASYFHQGNLEQGVEPCIVDTGACELRAQEGSVAAWITQFSQGDPLLGTYGTWYYYWREGYDPVFQPHG